MKIDFINRCFSKKMTVCHKCGKVIAEKEFFYIMGDNYDKAADFCPDCAAWILSNLAEKRSNGDIYFHDIERDCWKQI